MSEWKEDANRRRDTRQMKEGPEETGPRNKAGKPSPKKREKLPTLWEVKYFHNGRGLPRFTYVTADTRQEALGMNFIFGNGDATPKYEATRLHQKDREKFADLIDTGRWIDWHEATTRWVGKS